MPEDKENGKQEITAEYDITNAMRMFEPSDVERDLVGDVFFKFRRSADDRNRNFEYFDGINLIEYIEDSVRRFNTNYDERDYIEDWQARIHDPFTRNKVLAVLGKVNSVLPIASFVGRGDEDVRKGVLLTNLYEYAEEAEDYEEFMVHMLLEAIVKGTAIGYEGVIHKERKVRNVKGANDNISVTEETEITTRLPSVIVPLEEFYPSSVGIRTINQMPYCFRRYVTPYASFLQDWAMFEKSKYVQPQRRHTTDEKRPFYLDYISSEVNEGDVEVIQFYDRDNDQYVILANGVWLNPIVDGQMQEVVSPLPFNHKELPFWEIKFDFFGDFFYGKSLPDRLKSLQDVLNVLTNMLLDQSFLTIFPPLLTNGYDSIEEDYLRPGRRTPIDTQGLPISQAFQKLDLGTPSGWHQYILEYTRKIMEESSIDSVSSGNAGVGGRTTAQEIRVAADGVTSMLGLFGRMVNQGLKRKARLKAANILQYWTDPKTPMIRRILSDGKIQEFNKVFNTFKVGNAVMTGGKRGSKVIEFYADKKQLPTKKELQARAMVSEADSGKRTEIVALPGQYLRDFLFDVTLVSNPKKETSRDLDQALQLEKVRVYLSFFPNIVDINELAAETAEMMGDDPTRILKSDALQVPTDGGSEVDKGTSTQPTQNTANNMARSAGGNTAPNNQMVALKASLQGV
jgi:hypothetical protein